MSPDPDVIEAKPNGQSANPLHSEVPLTKKDSNPKKGGTINIDGAENTNGASTKKKKSKSSKGSKKSTGESSKKSRKSANNKSKSDSAEGVDRENDVELREKSEDKDVKNTKKSKKSKSSKSSKSSKKSKPKKKKKEPLLESPFETLDVNMTGPQRVFRSDHYDNLSLMSGDSGHLQFDDGISFLTLPKGLREEGGKAGAAKGKNKNDNNMKDQARINVPVPTTIAATYDTENPLPESPCKSEGSAMSTATLEGKVKSPTGDAKDNVIPSFPDCRQHLSTVTLPEEIRSGEMRLSIPRSVNESDTETPSKLSTKSSITKQKLFLPSAIFSKGNNNMKPHVEEKGSSSSKRADSKRSKVSNRTNTHVSHTGQTTTRVEQSPGVKRIGRKVPFGGPVEEANNESDSGSDEIIFFKEEKVQISSSNRMRWICTGVFFLCFAALIVIVIIVFIDKDDNVPMMEFTINDAEDKAFDDEPLFNDTFVYSNPIVLTPPVAATTEMAELDFDCNPFDQEPKFSHISDQCRCDGSIRFLPQDVIEARELILEAVITRIYGPLESLSIPPASSCSATNQATVWLSSGNNMNTGFLLQRFILALLFFETDGSSWDNFDKWLSSENECLWFGVKCSSQGVVYEIDLTANKVVGTIPSELGLLDGLASLSMSQNGMRGVIPTSILGLPLIRQISLDGNLMSGPLSSEIGIALKLRKLLLQSNFLIGSIPTEIGLATSLTDLNLNSNRVGGSLPEELGRLTRLQNLDLMNNQFFGQIPSAFGNLGRVKKLTLSDNPLGSSLPNEFGQLVRLQELRMDRMNLFGTLATELGLLNELMILSLAENGLQGSIPTELGELGQLESLSLNDNQLEGTIPSQLGQLSELIELRLDNNLLTGSLPIGLSNIFSFEEEVSDLIGAR